MSPSPRYAPPPAPRPGASGLESVRTQLVVELDRLKALLGGPDPLYLADLGSRLSALAAFLGGHPELSALAQELQAAELPGTDAEALRTHAIEVLTALTSESPSLGSPAPSTPAARSGSAPDRTGGSHRRCPEISGHRHHRAPPSR